jgi:hypothetical protein
VILGIALGSIAGLLLLLANRWPRLIRWLAVGLLVSCVIGSMHIDAFKSVTDFVVKTRLQSASSLETAWFMTHELLAAMGATAGMVVGAVIACAAVRLDRADKADRGVNSSPTIVSESKFHKELFHGS